MIHYVIEQPERSRQRFFADEESPSFTGQDAGEIPVEATLRKVQQK